jgi:hypothetical protein
VTGNAALVVVFAGVAGLYIRRYPVSGPAAVGIYLAFSLLLVLSLFPASQHRRTALVKLLVLGAAPIAIYTLFPPRRADAFSWQDGCVGLALVGAVLSGKLRGIWNVPLNLDFMSRLFLITVGSWCWTFIRPVPELGYSFRVSKEVVKQATVNFAIFAAIAIPRTAVPVELSRTLSVYRSTRRAFFSRLSANAPLKDAGLLDCRSGCCVRSLRVVPHT